MKINKTFKSALLGVIIAVPTLLTSCGSSKSTAFASAKNDPTQPRMISGEQVLATFCVDESYDKPGEYMAGLGIADDRPDRSHAIIDANRAAIADIASRYIGAVKSTIENYSKDVKVPGSKKLYESELKGGLQVIAVQVIDKYANVVCRQISQSATGGYVGYVVVHVSTEDAKKGLVEELEVCKVDIDKKTLLEIMDEELAVGAVKQRSKIDAIK